jgi:hypothetical protein
MDSNFQFRARRAGVLTGLYRRRPSKVFASPPKRPVSCTRDRWFESGSLQRRVCEPSVPIELIMLSGQPSWRCRLSASLCCFHPRWFGGPIKPEYLTDRLGAPLNRARAAAYGQREATADRSNRSTGIPHPVAGSLRDLARPNSSTKSGTPSVLGRSAPSPRAAAAGRRHARPRSRPRRVPGGRARCW